MNLAASNASSTLNALNNFNYGAGSSLGASNDLESKMKKMKIEASDQNALDNMRVEQSQTQLDIQAIIRKYGGTSAETAWADELTTIERKKKIWFHNFYFFSRTLMVLQQSYQTQL